MFSQIRSRILAYFIGLVLLISVLFGALSFLFTYYVEDSLFVSLLEQEKVLVEAQINAGQPIQPQLNFVRYYPSTQQLPTAISDVLKDEPERIEFSGPKQNGPMEHEHQNNKAHYHLVRLGDGFLVAEVSDYLVVRNIKGGMAKTHAVFIGMLIIIALWLAWSFAKRLIKPIEQLNAVLIQVKGDELPNGFAKQFNQDEIGLFAKELERAIDRVREFIAREQHFTRDISHELRTPLTITQGAITLLSDTSLTKEQLPLVERITSAQQQMQLCIEGLLALAREGETMHEPIPLLAVVEAAIVEHHQLIEDKAIELEVNVSNTATVTANPQALRIVIGNLIANAFSHTEQGEIDIDWQSPRLIIRNSGEGIAHDILPNVFASGVKGNQSQGLGIGLSLAKRLCDQQAIGIALASNEHGTTATLTFA
ncbi:sensor histidine kinase [Thalassotalea euphylliae]|uniref:histidine kinase n=1 Tax=Thalassotalea euphylliae TaxID=1655234 RepID=A0A3E0TZM0_9GAMM|nr:HAMP domain-containing sensor histidine kinase [Thalassotalea euphylliae]REL30098.1 sensor histidine kinase [Thalassotalea euphylliae]